MKKDYRDTYQDDSNHKDQDSPTDDPSSHRVNTLGLYGFTEDDWNQKFLGNLNIREFLGLFFLSVLGICFYQMLTIFDLFPSSHMGLLALDFGVFFVFGYFCFMISRVAIRKKRRSTGTRKRAEMPKQVFSEAFTKDAFVDHSKRTADWMKDWASNPQGGILSELDSSGEILLGEHIHSAQHFSQHETREEILTDGSKKTVRVEYLPAEKVKVSIQLQDAQGNITQKNVAEVPECDLEEYLRNH